MKAHCCSLRIVGERVDAKGGTHMNVINGKNQPALCLFPGSVDCSQFYGRTENAILWVSYIISAISQEMYTP